MVIPFVLFIDESIVFEDLFVKLAEKFHKRMPEFLSFDWDDDVNITVFLTTLDIIEEFPKDAELRTFGEAVIFMGTVHEALKDADRCTGLIVRGTVFGGAEQGAAGNEESSVVDCSAIVNEVTSGSSFRGGGNVEEVPIRTGVFGDVVIDVEFMDTFFLGEGVHELSLC